VLSLSLCTFFKPAKFGQESKVELWVGHCFEFGPSQHLGNIRSPPPFPSSSEWNLRAVLQECREEVRTVRDFLLSAGFSPENEWNFHQDIPLFVRMGVEPVPPFSIQNTAAVLGLSP
jgi:hypothetical protein